MDPFERQFRRRANIEAIIAFVVAVFVAYIIQSIMRFRGGNIFTVLIVVAIGGLWYHIRRVV